MFIKGWLYAGLAESPTKIQKLCNDIWTILQGFAKYGNRTRK